MHTSRQWLIPHRWMVEGNRQAAACDSRESGWPCATADLIRPLAVKVSILCRSPNRAYVPGV